MTESTPHPQHLPELAIDCLASALFAVFVGILFLGYADPSDPYTPLASLPLVGSLVTLFWANFRADRFARSQLSAPDT